MITHRKEFIQAANSFVKECEICLSIARDADLQRETCLKLEQFVKYIEAQKCISVKNADEDLANLLLGYESVAKCLQAEIEMWLLLKEGKPDEAWDRLVTAQMAAVDAVRAHEGFSHVEHHSHRLQAVEELIFPPQVFVSSGMLVKQQICSICGQEYEECEHLIGMPYMGEFCYIIAKDISLDHVSIVKEPADKRCRVIHFEHNGSTRNRMTWKLEIRSDAADSGDLNDANAMRN